MDNLQKISNKGAFVAFDAESNNLKVTIPRYNEGTGVKENVEVNLDLEYHANHLAEIDAQIAALKKEKNTTQAILDKFKVDVDSAKVVYAAQKAAEEAARIEAEEAARIEDERVAQELEQN